MIDSVHSLVSFPSVPFVPALQTPSRKTLLGLHSKQSEQAGKCQASVFGQGWHCQTSVSEQSERGWKRHRCRHAGTKASTDLEVDGTGLQKVMRTTFGHHTPSV